MNLSNNQLELYRSCPFAYHCRYFLKIKEPENENFTFGTKFHQAIPIGLSQFEIIDKMVKKLYTDKDFRSIALNPDEEAEFEKKSYVTMSDLPFVTILDMVNSQAIGEFKSASEPWKKEMFDKSFQPHIYLKSEHERTGIWKKFFYFILTKSMTPQLQTVEIKFNQKVYDEAIETAWKMLKDFDFKCKTYDEKGYCMYCNWFRENHFTWK